MGFVLFQIPGAPDDEAVRIFLEFERVESAIKGRILNCVNLRVNLCREIKQSHCSGCSVKEMFILLLICSLFQFQLLWI